MSNVIMCSECKMCDGDRCNYFDNDSDRESTIACILFEPQHPTLFDRITASPEVLAEKLVFAIGRIVPDYNHVVTLWYSTIIPDITFETRTEAIAATVAKLKEVENAAEM